MNVASSSTCYTRFGLVDDEPHTVYVYIIDIMGICHVRDLHQQGFQPRSRQHQTRRTSGSAFITDRNRPSLVVLAIKDYERLAGRGTSLLEVLMPDDYQEFDFEPPKAHISAQPAKLD